jgi:hypothetical protein
MSLTPVSRDHLRSLKKNRDEEIRLNQINNYVRNIYSAVVNKAQTSTDTYYRTTQISEFERKHMPEILDTLKTLFPDCLVEYQHTIGGNDGKMYDINKLDESMRQILLNPSYKTKVHEQIVIEWS